MRPLFFGKFTARTVAATVIVAALGAGAATAPVAKFDELRAAIEGFATATSDLEIIVNANIRVTSPIVVNAGDNGARNITIRGKDSSITLTRATDGVLLFVRLSGSARLTLENIVINGNYPVFPLSGAGMPLVAVNAGSNVVMGAGAVLRNNMAADGSAARVEGALTMSGGRIDSCVAFGAGNGSAVHVSGGKFTMTGGTISGNTQGDAVYVRSGAFAMTGGAITNNYGGVYVSPAADTVTLGRSVKIRDNYKGAAASNVSLASGRYIVFGAGASAPAASMDVGVSTASASGVFVQSGAAAAHAPYFFADAAGKRVVLDGAALKIADDTRPGISGAIVTQTNALTYDGRPQQPAFRVEINGVVVPPANYDVIVDPQTDAGAMYAATIRGARTGAYSGSKLVTWAIGKADLPVSKWPTPAPIDYGSALSASTLEGGDTNFGAFSWTFNVARPTVNSMHEVTFTPKDINNYNTKSSLLRVNVTPAQLVIAGTPASADKEYDGTTRAAATGVALEGLKFGERLTEGVDYTVIGEFDGASVGYGKTVTVSVILNDNDVTRNYSPASKRIDGAYYEIFSARVPKELPGGYLTPVAGQDPHRDDITTGYYRITGIRWTNNATGGLNPDRFDYGVRYTAEFTLTPAYGYMIDYGMADGYFTIAGADDGDVFTDIGVRADLTAATVSVTFQPTRPPAVITLSPELPASITVTEGNSEALWVSAGVTQGARLVYQWYVCASGVIDGSCLAAPGVSNSSSYVVSGREAGVAYYYCKVSGTDGGALPVDSRMATVTVKKIPNSASFTFSLLSSAYSGLPQNVSVTPRAGVGAVRAVRYNNSVETPVRAGVYAVAVDVAEGTGYVAGSGVPLGNFVIEKAQISVNAAACVAAPKVYDGATDAALTHVAFVGLASGETLAAGADYRTLGAMFESANAGSNTVIAGIALTESAAAANYTLSGGSVRVPATITKRAPTAGDFAPLPTGRRENGTPQPIASVYAKPSLLGMGEVTAVYYDGLPASAAHPVGARAYAVTVDVADGLNFYAASGLPLGNYTIRPDIIENIANAKIEITGSYVYSGAPHIPPADNVFVTFDGMRLEHRVDYTFTASDNLNAGTASMVVTGMGHFTGTVAEVGRFAIAKRIPELSDLSYGRTASAVYNAEAQPVSVSAAAGKEGLGAVTALYNGSPAPPVNAGVYDVVVNIAEGANFTARQSLRISDAYAIQKKSPVRADLIFSIPTDHYYTGEPQGIDPVTLKGTGYGSVTVLYNGSAAPPAEAGTYELYLKVSGGENYLPAEGKFDTYVIAAEKGAAHSPARAIPVGGNGAAVVAPVDPVAAEFAAGPNPVGKSAGAVNFFRAGKRAAAGELTVYDASGNVVSKVKIIDNSAAVSGRRVVGAWDLKDAGGRLVPEGTYLVRGAIAAADGQRERVSILVGVR